MARCSAFIFTAIFCIISVNSLIPERNLSDPSVEIIKHQDAEEGYDFRVKESLVCKETKTSDNVVVKVDGDPPHLYAKVNVTCLAGKHFTGSTKNTLSVQCLPLPHPCMCMAAWQTTDDYQLVYDFNCTTDKTIDANKDSKDNLPLYPLELHENDDLQCPNPTLERGTIKIVHGHLFSDGCNVILTCYHGLKFPDGKSVWNLTCVPVSVIPKQLVWIPQYSGTPTCSEGTDDVTNIQTVESEAANSENEQTDTKATPETANKQPELIIHSYDLNPQRDVGYEIKDDITEPEEDLIGTFHENNINTNQVEDIHITIENPETNPNIIEQNKREVQEELTNSVDNLNVQEDGNNIESKESAVNNIVHNGVDYYTEEQEQPIYENTKTNITTETKDIEDVDNNVVENEFEKNIPFEKEVPEEVEERLEEFVTDQEGTEELEAEEPEVQHTEEQVYEEKEEEEHKEYEPEEEIYEENTNEDNVPLEEQQTEESKIKDDGDNIEVHENEEKEYNELPENAADHEEVIKEDTESSEKTNNEENINEENRDVEENAADEEEMHEEIEHHENNIDEENTEVNEEISEQSESNLNAVFTEVYPILPPSIKEPSRIYDAIKAHNRNFEGEEEEKEDGEGEEVTKDISAESDVEPPGFLSDVQISPVRASKEEIKTDERAVCSLPVQTGFCKAYFRRFHFNSKTGECEKFVYGGCGGNGNNFETLRDCENKCVKHSS